MKSTTKAAAGLGAGRSSMELAARLRQQLVSGRIAPGGYLPTERDLAARHRVAPMTARRALKALEQEGLVSAEPRRGYRVLAPSGGPDKGLPIAYLTHGPKPNGEFWDQFHRTLLGEFQRVAAERGWPLLAVSADGHAVGEVIEQLRSARVCGVVLDTIEPELLVSFRRAELPVVLIDRWGEGQDADLDVVVQDSFLGGVLAAMWLAGRGHRRIGWVGPQPMAGDLQIVERYAGAVGALDRAGLALAPELRVRAPLLDLKLARELARELLARPDRPTAVLALWQTMTTAVAEAARGLGLEPGRDFEMVGWSTEEHYRSGFLAGFGGGAAPPAITWSIARMAEAAVACLRRRRTEPRAPAVHLRVPTRLTLAE
jgi:DNA-binding LacI/PurR family transcriptional regulator